MKHTMKLSISIPDDQLDSFKQALKSNQTNFEIISNIDGRTTFIINALFENELFYLGTSFGIKCLANSIRTPSHASL